MVLCEKLLNTNPVHGEVVRSKMRATPTPLKTWLLPSWCQDLVKGQTAQCAEFHNGVRYEVTGKGDAGGVSL